MNKLKESAENPKIYNQFPVVGIGASAGGLEAVKQFLQAVPLKSGMAYVYVQHLSPTHESTLPEILRKVSKIPVQAIVDNIHLEEDHFYIIPENKIVTAVDGVLKLAPLDDKHHKIKVVDLFFSSLAVVHQSYAVGVVLSGTLNDGTLGLQVIKAYGGMTFAQDEASAAFDGMPKNAVRAGAVDFIFSPSSIVEHLLTINHPFQADPSKTKSPGTIPEKDADVYKQLLTVLRVRRGVDFTYYKPSTLKRRIVRRMALNMIEKPIDYLVFLRENKSEQDALYNDMLISVTNFFRDEASFEMLCNTIFPQLIEMKSHKESLRIWIAGCATGEEAYSMAICLQEHLGDKAAALKIQIFATDISEIAISKARTGIYKLSDMDGLSSSRRDQFFTKLDGNYQVNKTIRDMCVFANHNLLKDPPFSKIDVVSCRNVMIYLEPVLQKRALNTFHYALNEYGFLMLGKSESIGDNTDLFASYNNHEKIYQRKGARGRFMQVASPRTETDLKNIDLSVLKEEVKKDVFKSADDLVLSRYAPPGVVVNDDFDIIQFRGNTEKWLALVPGKASLNILKMTREGLAFELRNLLQDVKKTNAPARKEGIVFHLENRKHYVNIEASPLKHTADLHYLVLFENIKGLATPDSDFGITKKPEKDSRDLRIEQLEKELVQTRTDMRTITEEQDVVNEELQSANMELLSSTEELQSLNEELETSKEELQSTNEEIVIVNNELLDRNEQLNSGRIYTESIINTIRDSVIVMDKELKVKRATTGFYSKFQVTEQETVGQYFYELGNGQWNIPALRHLLENVLPQQKTVSDFEVSYVFPRIGHKVMLLNTHQLDLAYGDQFIILAIEDITDKRKVEKGLAEVEKLFQDNKERLRLAVDVAGLGTWDYNPVSRELILDKRCKELIGVNPVEEITYNQFIGKIHQERREYIKGELKKTLAGNNEGEFEQEFRLAETENNKPKWIRLKAKAYFSDENTASRIVGTAMDITVQKTHEESTLELLKKKDDFISIASHELKTPVTCLKATLQVICRMKDNPSPEKLPKLVEQASKSMERISFLIEDLLNTSKINMGQFPLKKDRFNIAKVIEECCSHVRDAGYDIKIEGDKDLQVCADADRISQVVTNFVNNAVKYAPDSKKILVRILKENTYAKISVTDYGPGIPPEQRSHLFDRYYQADTSGILYAGLGLGLYISAEIIKRHDGEIGLESKMGKGSTFWFCIPL